jgi:hypothetical protein
MMNINFKAKTAEKNYAVYLNQLLRLRQAASHPFLLERCIKDLFEVEDIIALKRRLKCLKKDKRPMYEQIDQWVSKSTTSEQNQGSGKVAFGRSDFGKDFDFEGFLTEADHEKIYARLICSLCSDLPQDPVQTECSHIFCRSCLEGNMHTQAATVEFDYNTCPKCEKIIDGYAKYVNPLFKSSDDGAGSEHSTSSQPKEQNCSKNDPNFKPHIKDSDWLKMVLEGRKKLLPSSKAIALKSQILRWLHEAPDDKILSKNIFHFTTFPR